MTVTLSVLLFPPEDLPSVWLAHCLEIDVITQGNSVPHAIEMLLEAVEMTWNADVVHHLNPFRRRAPEEEWALFRKLTGEDTGNDPAPATLIGKHRMVAMRIVFDLKTP